MTEERIRNAINALPEDQRKQVRDAFFAAAAGLTNLAELLEAAAEPDLAKELTIAMEAKALVSRSQLSKVL
jgi:hypothetical protein